MAQAIALLTDFGAADVYVGQLKAVLSALSPSSRLLDISHDVEPFNVVQAGFFLAASAPYFPEGTVFVAVVDPTVGTDRRVVALKAINRVFLAPDNGLLSLVMAKSGQYRAFDLTGNVPKNLPFATFHGRDVFAPLAAKLASGAPPSTLGREMNSRELDIASWSEPKLDQDGIEAAILHIDRFGNCVTNLETGVWLEKLKASGQPALSSPGHTPLQLADTYARLQGDQPGLLPGSQGYLEIAMCRRSAARNLALSIGDRLRLST